MVVLGVHSLQEVRIGGIIIYILRRPCDKGNIKVGSFLLWGVRVGDIGVDLRR